MNLSLFPSPTLPRDVAQLLLDKLYAGHLKPSEAKSHAQRYGVTLKGRTMEQVCGAISKATRLDNSL